MKDLLALVVSGTLIAIYLYVLVKMHGLHVEHVAEYSGLAFVVLIYSLLYSRSFFVLLVFVAYLFVLYVFELPVSVFMGVCVLFIGFLVSVLVFRNNQDRSG